MAAAHLSLTRRALLAGACTVPFAAGAASAHVATPRHPEQGSHQSTTLMGFRDSGPMNTQVEGSRTPCSWIADQVRNDDWDRALKNYQKAEAALAAAAHTDNEALYDRLGTRHDRALQRLLLTPAPTIAALALKLDLTLYERAEEFLGDAPAMRALKQDAHRLSLS